MWSLLMIYKFQKKLKKKITQDSHQNILVLISHLNAFFSAITLCGFFFQSNFIETFDG